MTEFEKAMKEYEKHFNLCYPRAIGYGYPCRTDEENIALIKKCIAEDKPYDFNPPYDPNCDY